MVPADDVELQAPPELARGGMQNFWFTALPALSGLGSVAYLLAGPPNPITYVAGSFFLISALAMVVGSLLSARSQNRGQVQQQRWEFLRHLTRTRDRVRRIAQAQRDREEWGGPPPDTLWSVAASERLWERRPDDDDFGAVRIGVGRQQLAATAGSRRVRAGRGPRPAVGHRAAAVRHHPPHRARPAAAGARCAGSRPSASPRPTTPTRPARWCGPCSARPRSSTRRRT